MKNHQFAESTDVLFGQGSFDGMIGVNRPQNTQNSYPRPDRPWYDLVSGDFNHRKHLKRTSFHVYSLYTHY